MTVTMVILKIGDVAISVSRGMTYVTVEEQRSLGNSSHVSIAAPAPAAHTAMTLTSGGHSIVALSRVPEVRCRTSQSRVKTEDATQTTSPVSFWIMIYPTTHAPGA